MADYKSILTDLKAKKYKPVYFLMGDEPFYIDKISDYIEQHVLDDAGKEFNQTILYGQDVDLARIVGEAKRFPMMSEHTVIIIKEAQHLKELGKKGDDDSDAPKEKQKTKSVLELYLENPQPTTILVFCYKYKTIDKRTSLAKTLDKKAEVFESKKMYDDKIPDWIMNQVKEQKMSISVQAALLLAEYLGNDLSKIYGELEKLQINVKQGTEINVDHIQTYIGISKDYNVFELQHALARRDVLKANRIINYFAANPKDNPVVVTISTLFGYFSKLLMYYCLADKSAANVARELKINPYFVKDYAAAANNYGGGKLLNIITALRQADLQSKGVGTVTTDQSQIMKELIYKILH